MSAFEDSELEPGVIMVLHGLSKVELNDTLVEVDKKVISETDQTVRWKCIKLDDESVISIKRVNLKSPPEPTAEVIKQCEDLCSEALALIEDAKRSGKNREIKRRVMDATMKLNEAIKLVPQSGLAHNQLGDIAHYTGQSPTVIMKHMRRAVANGLNTPDEKLRIFRARLGYSGALGNSGDIAGEQEQLLMCLREEEILNQYENYRPGCLHLLCFSLTQEGNYDDAMRVLFDLRDSHPVLGNFCGRDLKEEVRRQFLVVSYNFYKLGVEIEKQGDKLEGDERLAKYDEAKTLLHKAIQCAPDDEATKSAWFRIKAKLNPQLTVIQAGEFTVAGNFSDGPAVIDSSY